MHDNKFFTSVTPEEVGISSKDVTAFVSALIMRGIHVHSVIGIRHDRIFLEAYAAPYKKERFHRMYSVSKSFVAGAIALLADEGRISLDDKIAAYFPDMIDENTHPYILEATIRDLLMMASPHRGTTYDMEKYDEWLPSFFKKPPVKRPGTVFNYDTSATYVLDVLVERLTGKPFLDYMKDKMLREMGFSENARCVKSPDGYSWGGSGVLCTSMDLARYALLYLDGGRWNGKQMISENFVKEATSCKIKTQRCGFTDAFAEGLGYGYYIWQTPFNSFSFLGMGDQLAMCFPEKDMLIVMNCDTQGQSSFRSCIFELIDRYLLSTASDTPLDADNAAYESLADLTAALSIPLPRGNASSPLESKINGVKYYIGENGSSISEFTLYFDKDGGTVKYRNPKGDKELRFGRAKYTVTEFPEYDYSGDTIRKPLGRGYDTAVCGVWESDTMFIIRADVIDDYNGNLSMIFSFKDDDVTLYIDSCAEGFIEEYNCLRMGKAVHD